MSNGFVDDLLCCFRGADLLKRSVIYLPEAVGVGHNDSQALNSAIDQLEAALTEKQREIDAIHASTSWRLTAGMRRLKSIFKG